MNPGWISYSALSEILQNTGRLYVYRDELGKVVLRNLEELELNAILGDYSLAYDYFDVASEKMNALQIKTMAATLLSLYNQEAESLTLECLGDVSVRAGSNFTF